MSRNLLRPLAIVTFTALMIALSSCSPFPASADGSRPSPTATTTQTANPDSTVSMPPGSSADAESLPSLTFAEGASLSPDSDIRWADGFAADDDWKAVAAASAPGRWAYTNADQSCTASFRGGVLGDAGDMDDREATDAVIAVLLDEDPSVLSPLLYDSYFFLGIDRDARVDHRQFSYTVNGTGDFIAVRAFVAVDYSAEVRLTCVGTNIDAVAAEVMSKNWIVIEAP